MPIIFLLACLLFLFGIFVFIYVIFGYIRADFGKYPPALPSLGKIRKVLITELDSYLSNSKKPLYIADLGSGFGNLLVPLAKKYPQHHFYGYEWSKAVYWISKIFTHKYKNIKIYRQNFLKAPLNQFQIIMMYTTKETAQELYPKFQKELKKGTFIFSETFKIEDLKPFKEIPSNTYGIPTNIYIYKM